MIPFFLSPGRHATEDMDDARQRLAEKHPNVEFRCAPALGRHPLLVQILLERARDLESAAAHD
jgi:sirohydrochlorin ferrochelatase